MSGFGAVFGRKGVVGFSGPVLGVSSGVVGFNVAKFLRAAREICRLARPDVGASTKKFALRAHNGQKLAFDGALGKYFRGSTVVGSRRASLLCRVPGSRAHLLAVLTLQCAAKPHWWHGGQPAQDTTSRVNVRIKGARVRRMRSQKQKMDLTAHRRPDAPHASSDTTEAEPRRVPPLVACGGRAVGAEKSRYQQHVVSYNPLITPNTGQLPHQGSRRIRNPRASREARGLCAETAGFEPARGYAPLPP